MTALARARRVRSRPGALFNIEMDAGRPASSLLESMGCEVPHL